MLRLDFTYLRRPLEKAAFLPPKRALMDFGKGEASSYTGSCFSRDWRYDATTMDPGELDRSGAARLRARVPSSFRRNGVPLTPVVLYVYDSQKLLE